MLHRGDWWARAAAVSTAGLLISLAGCTGTGTGTGTGRSAGGAADSAPAQSPGRSVTLDCATSHPLDGSRPAGTGDVVVGPLRFDAIALGHPGAIADSLNHVVFTTIGTELLPGATVTVSVAPPARGWAAIAAEGAPAAGSFSVTYVGCPAAVHPDGVWWAGGFTLRDRTSACLPLDVRIHGERSPRHVIISFWDKSCTTGER